MNDEQKAKYVKLRDQNNYFLQQISFGQSKLSEMLERRRELEMEISTSDVSYLICLNRYVLYSRLNKRHCLF